MILISVNRAGKTVKYTKSLSWTGRYDYKYHEENISVYKTTFQTCELEIKVSYVSVETGLV